MISAIKNGRTINIPKALKTNNIKSSISNLANPKKPVINSSDEDIDKLKNYINGYWARLRQDNTEETKNSLGLPHPYFVPSSEVIDGFAFPHMFYWDSYFIAQGLWGSEYEQDIVGMTENMFDLIRRFGFVPNSNSFSHLSRSQPPLLSSLVKQVQDNLKPDDHEWLYLAYARISEEIRTVWLGIEQPHNRLVHKGLSRYYDTNVLHVLAEAESGWDYTTRFDDHCMDYLPIDLNSFLYKYETDLVDIATTLGRDHDADIWRRAAKRRKDTINELMWYEKDGMYYDYDFRSHGLSPVMSLATFTPMFAGLCTQEQAERLVANLEYFETDFGLTTTDKYGLPPADKQWATPNGWAPLHDLVVDGLLHYGFKEEAKTIAKKWVNLAAHGLKTHGTLHEKYNVINPLTKAKGSVYPDQHGFGWTNGVTAKFIRFIEED